MKKNVAVLMGGYSSEYEISMKSGQVVYNNLDKDLYNAFRIVVTKDKWFYLDNNNKEFNISKNDFSLTIENKKIKFDVAFIVIHGSLVKMGFYSLILNQLEYLIQDVIQILLQLHLTKGIVFQF